MSEAQISIKLLINKSTQKVLFAEAGKEFVDLLFHILSLPLGTVVEYLTTSSMVGSLGHLYGSLENLSTDYFQDGLDKDCLLHPKPPAGSTPLQIPLLAVNPTPDAPGANKLSGYIRTYYCCKNHFHFSDVAGAKCPDCKVQMNQALQYVAEPAIVEGQASSSVGGYMKELVPYMITDKLVVVPMSMTYIIALMTIFSVHGMAQLEERVVYLDINQGMALLKASLTSKTVLTDVFLGKKAAGGN